MTLLSILLSATLTLAFQNEPDGFRGMGWGTDIALVKNMQLIKTNPAEAKLYIKSDDSLTIGGATLESIIYGFNPEGKFESVTISLKDYKNFLALKLDCFKKYGDVEELEDSTGNEEKYLWQGKTTNIYLTFSRSTNIGILYSSPGNLGKEEDIFK